MTLANVAERSRPQRRLPVADRERQGVPVADLPVRHRRRAGRADRLVLHGRGPGPGHRPGERAPGHRHRPRARGARGRTRIARRPDHRGDGERTRRSDGCPQPPGRRAPHRPSWAVPPPPGRPRRRDRARRLPPLGRLDPARRRGHRVRGRGGDAHHPDPAAGTDADPQPARHHSRGRAGGILSADPRMARRTFPAHASI